MDGSPLSRSKALAREFRLLTLHTPEPFSGESLVLLTSVLLCGLGSTETVKRVENERLPWHASCASNTAEVTTMKHIFLSTVLVSLLGACSATPAWARGVPHGGAVFHRGFAAPRVVVVPTYGVYGPAFGWGFYDPFWYGPVAPYVVPSGVMTGDLRLEVTPKSAEVFVDGGYAGVVNDFNGHFHHLSVTPGGHRIEISAPGFEALTFNAYVQPDRTTDYKANMIPAAQ
jgi:hypothetical protein